MRKVRCRYCGSDNYRHDASGEYYRYTKLYCMNCKKNFSVANERMTNEMSDSDSLSYLEGDVDDYGGFNSRYDLYDYYYRLYYDDDFDGDYEEYFEDKEEY